MSAHILSVIGTSLYEPVVYYDNEFESSEQEFIQLALIEKYQAMLESDPDSRITFFVTAKAGSQNVENRSYKPLEIDTFAPKWVSARKQQVNAETQKIGMRQQFHQQFPNLADRVEWIPIADAQTEQQISEVFRAIYDSLREQDEIIFDITHSFRSIPMLVLTVINYAKVLKQCSLNRICYGAYEASSINDQVRKAPINDLTVYNEVLEWTTAADVFMRFGNAAMMRDVFNRKFRLVPNEEKKNWSSLKRIVTDIETLSDTIQTGRGVDGGLLNKKKTTEFSVKSAFEQYKKTLDSAPEGAIDKIEPLTLLLEKVKESFEIFDCSTNYEVGLAVVQWAIRNDMVQLGYTALEETIKSYLCWKYQLEEIGKYDRDLIVGNNMVGLAKYAAGNTVTSKHDRLSYLWKIVLQNEKLREILAESPQKYYSLQKLFEEDNLELAKLLNDVKDARNDINHFGMRAEPRPAKSLKEQLESDYSRLTTLICTVQEERED